MMDSQTAASFSSLSTTSSIAHVRTRRRRKAVDLPYVAPPLKPVFMDVHLDFHEQLINKVGQSLQHTKKRLHNTELMLNLEPPEHEPAERAKWESTVHALLYEDPKPEFPTLSQLRKEYDAKKLERLEAKSKARAASREAWMLRANHILEQQAKNLQKKVLTGKGIFGGDVKGETIRTIHNYTGVNSYHGKTRTLVRKDGHFIVPEGLPPWFHPAYYDVQTTSEIAKRDIFYEAPFKAVGRDHSPVVNERKEQMRQRKQGLRQAMRDQQRKEEERQRMIQQKLMNERRGPRKPLPTVGTPSQERRQALHSRPAGLTMVLSGSITSSRVGYSLPGMTPASSSSSSSLSHDEDFRVDRAEEEELSLVSSTISEEHSRSRGRTKPGSLAGEDWENAAHKRQRRRSTRTPKIATESDAHAEQPRHKLRSFAKAIKISEKKQALMRSKTIPQRRLTMNPIHSHHAYAIKIMTSEENLKNLRKTKDYAMNALTHQKPVIFHDCEFEPTMTMPPVASAPALLAEGAGDHPTPNQSLSETHLSQQHSLLGSGQLVNASVSTFLPGTAETDSATPSPAPLSANSAPRHHKYTSDIFMVKNIIFRSAEQLMHPKKASTPPANLLVPDPFEPSTSSKKHRNSSAGFGNSPHNSRPSTGHGSPKNSNSRPPSRQTTVKDEMGFELPPKNVSVVSSIDAWCRRHRILRHDIMRSTKSRDNFLDEHRTLPSIELSLQGLLLEENPYTAADELIRANEGREIDNLVIT